MNKVSPERESEVFQHALIVNNWHKTFTDLKDKKILFTSEPSEINIAEMLKENDKGKILSIEKEDKIYLNPSKGYDFILSHGSSITAYDESIEKIHTLKGSVFFTCHCLVRLKTDDYDPICELTANYFTRAKATAEKSNVFHYVDIDEESKQTIESEYKKQYHVEREKFLLDHVKDTSLLIIDGPLIGRMLSSRTIRLARELLDRDIITIYVTKNSDSLMIANEISHGNYNSDLDWANENLDLGHRSSFFKYKDQSGGHTEIFCYLKSFDNVSPLRVSFLPELFSKDEKLVSRLMEVLYYLVLNQGTPNDPQIRFISIAEFYAKDILKVANPYGKMIQMGLVPTVNQSRWGRA